MEKPTAKIEPFEETMNKKYYKSVQGKMRDEKRKKGLIEELKIQQIRGEQIDNRSSRRDAFLNAAEAITLISDD